MAIRRSLQSAHRTNRVAYAIVAVALLVAAFVGGRATAPDASPPLHPPTQAPPASDVASPADSAAEASPTRDGAVAAATSFARIMGSITAGDAGYVEAMAAIAAPSWRDDARRLAQNGLDFVAKRYGPGGTITFEPVRYRVASFDGESATVAIWGVVLSSPRDGVDATWGTGTIELALVDGQWRMTGGESMPGPTPHQLEPEDSAPITTLERFSEYRRGPRP